MHRSVLSQPSLHQPGGAPVAGFLFLFLLMLGLTPKTVEAAAPIEPAEKNQTRIMETSQNAIGRQVGDYVFSSSNGKTLNLSDLKGKPLVISMVYSACAHTCPIITQTLIDAVAVARGVVGNGGFRVITIGFDVANDTPTRMAAFARRQGIPLQKNWQVLSGTQTAVEGLARDIGFEFFPSIKGFDHLNQTTIIDKDGHVFRQIYGQSFESVYLVEPLKALVFDTDTPFSSFQDLANKIRLFCTIYDPNTDRYQFDYSMFFRIGVGFSVIMTLLIIVIRGWRQAPSTTPKTPKSASKPASVDSRQGGASTRTS